MAGRGVDEPPGRGHHPLAAPAAAHELGDPVEVAHGGVALGVEDHVHVPGAPHHPKLGHRLVGGNDQLHARSGGGHQAGAGVRVPGPSGAVEGVVLGGLDGAGEPELACPFPAPLERGLAPRAVVVEREAGVVVATLDHRLSVVGHRLGSHHPHPRHRRGPPQPGQVAIVFSPIVVPGVPLVVDGPTARDCSAERTQARGLSSREGTACLKFELRRRTQRLDDGHAWGKLSKTPVMLTGWPVVGEARWSTRWIDVGLHPGPGVVAIHECPPARITR